MIIMGYLIDNIDKRILFELERNARIPDVKLAKIVGKSKDAVRYRIKKLEEDEIIKEWKTWIDLAKLGYRSATLVLTLMNLPDKKKKLIEEIKNNPKTYWIGVAEGSWNLAFSPFIKTNEDLFEIKSALLSKYHNLIIDIQTTSLVSVSVHEKTFLSNQQSKLITFTEYSGEAIELDDISKKILKEIYFNSRENIATIADKLHLSVDIIKGRMKKMEEQGIIIRYTIAIDYHKIGFELYKSSIYLKSSSKMQEIMKYAEQSDKIINIVKQIAPWDLEFVLFCTSFDDYNKTISKFTEKFKDSIKKVETATMSEDIIFPCNKLPFD